MYKLELKVEKNKLVENYGHATPVRLSIFAHAVNYA